MKIDRRREEETNCIATKRSVTKKNRNEVAIFREPTYLIQIGLGLVFMGMFMVSIPIHFFTKGTFDGIPIAILGAITILMGLKVNSLDERVNTFLDPKRGRVRVEKRRWFRSIESQIVKRSEIAHARVLDKVDSDGDQMYGIELLMNDGSTLPLSSGSTSYKGEWEKAVRRVNQALRLSKYEDSRAKYAK